jgi:predicted aspartyl protease
MRIRLALTSYLAALCLHAQAAHPPAGNEIPFEYREGMIWLKVQTPKSSEPLNFLLDSGAGASVLNLSTAQRLGLHLANRIEVQGVGSTAIGYFPQRLCASAAGVPLPKRYVAVNLDKLSDACHCDVDGLLGAEFFRDRIIQIDFAAHKVRILAPGTPLAGEEILPLTTHRKAFLAPVTINEHERQWLRVDTGCASALQWVTASAPREERSQRIAIALSQVQVDSVATAVRIGRTKLASVSTDLHDRALFSGEDGLLGNGILSRFRSVTFDTVSCKLILKCADTP